MALTSIALNTNVYVLYENEQKPKDMKKYNYFYYAQPIQKSQFTSNVPENWEDEYDNINGYSHGGYRAIEREVEA